MQHVYENFLTPMTDTFKVPKHPELSESQYFSGIAEELKEFNGATLKKAYEHFFKAKKHTTMPTIREMVDVCEKMQQALQVIEKHQRNVSAWEKEIARREATERAWSTERRQWAKDRLLECQHSKQAAEEGWISWLYDHYRYNDHPPTDGEIKKMLRSFGSDKAAMQRYPGGVKVYAGMLAKRAELKKELTDLVLYGVISHTQEQS